MAPALVEASSDPRFDPSEEFVRPPVEDFWEKYSKRLEFPTSWVGALLVWVAAAALFFAYSKYLSTSVGGEVPVRLLDVDTGPGSADGGTAGPGADQVLAGDDRAFEVPAPVEPLPTLPAASEPITTPPRPVASPQNGTGNKPGPGTGGDGQGTGQSTGNGGGRPGFGWTLKFKFEDAREFSKQLASAGAVIFVPEGGLKGQKGLLFADLNNPQVGRAAEKADSIFAGRLGMYEQDAKKIGLMLKFLGAPAGPGATYGVFFPKSFVDELARKEVAYRNRRVEDIEKTTFTLTMRDGQYEVTVVDQKVKK